MAEAPRSFLERVTQDFSPKLGQWVRDLFHHLPAALVVASLVTIGHHQLHLLDAIDSYAFLAVGNIGSNACKPRERWWKLWHPEQCQEARVAVVSIDQLSHETYYRERSPLNRCELLRDLEALYKGRYPPKLMVIDLDLSPARLIVSEQNETACEQGIYELLQNSKNTKTVLMEPFPVKKPHTNMHEWRVRMMDAGVVFGDPTLSVRYGLLTKLEHLSKGLAVTAFHEWIPRKTISCCLLNHESKQLLINPRQYRLGITISKVSEVIGRSWLKEADGITIPPLPYEKDVVFFGATYGETDLYLTPVGYLYGVEIHAAAFMSLLEPTSDFFHLFAFLLEIAIGLIFGLFIDYSWRSYYHLRLSSDDACRQRAPLRLIKLAAVLCALVLLVTFLSIYLLGYSDLWLSPIPIALGMLIESFFTGAVHGAVKEGLQQRKELASTLNQAFNAGPDRFRAEIDAEERKQLRIAHHHPSGLIRRLAFYGILGSALYTLFH